MAMNVEARSPGRLSNALSKQDLAGKKGLVLGIANDSSIAYGCAEAFKVGGAELAVTYFNEKAEPFVRPLALALDSSIVMPCNVEQPEQLQAVFDAINERWGRLDFVLHSIAYAPKKDLASRVTDCSPEGFTRSMWVSCYSFIQVAKLAEPLMPEGGCLLTMSYYGAEKVVAHYNIMGPVKAALEATTRYMAYELGPKGIRVHAISPGPIRTRAASGIPHFDELLELAAQKAPEHHLANIEDVGNLAAFLASDAGKSITGSTIYVDGGYHIVD